VACALTGIKVLPLVFRQRIEVLEVVDKVKLGNELELFRLREGDSAVGNISVSSGRVTTTGDGDVARFGHDVDLLVRKYGA